MKQISYRARIGIVVGLILILAVGGVALLLEANQQLNRAERLWKQQGIDSYRISVSNSSNWVMRTFDLTVRNGEIVSLSHTCKSGLADFGICNSDPTYTDYSVPGLFEYVRTVLSDTEIDNRWKRITYDPTYGYPTSIVINDPQILDEESALTVLSFEVLDAPADS
ncbi:hypothetical protein EKD04_008440 [Chloroflexales bacterium ZM16-3]|nr:hypothetical protein [Chloroflexales bacterium ZM16-3]